jgi:hypothetical protein
MIQLTINNFIPLDVPQTPEEIEKFKRHRAKITQKWWDSCQKNKDKYKTTVIHGATIVDDIP